MEKRNSVDVWLSLLALVVVVPLLFLLLGTMTDPTYQAGLTARYTAQEQRREVEQQQWGATLRVWGEQAGELGRWLAVAGSAAAIVWVSGRAVTRWQEERTRRAEIVETNTTQRAMIGARRDVVLAYIAAYGGRAGTLAGERGVFLDASGEFVPADTCAAELRAARRLTG